MNYKPLMQSPEIPWHNPKELPISLVPDGWRLLTDDESDSPPLDTLVWFGDIFAKRPVEPGFRLTHWDTYITREPIPSKYAHLLEPDYSDPAYRASVEEAFRNGAAVEWSYKSQSRWKKKTFRWFYWNQYKYRIAPQQPAKDPEPDSDSHKMAVLMAARANKPTQRYSNAMGWVPCDDVDEVLTAIADGERVRLKPAPVKVPLSDYRVSEAIKIAPNADVVRLIVGTGVLGITTDCNRTWSLEYLAENAKIHRNGTWQDCFRLEEGGK